MIDAQYPPELKPRGVILEGSRKVVRDPLSVIMKPRPDHPSVSRDTYVHQGVVPRVNIMTVGAASINDDRTLQNIIRTSLILSFRNLSVSNLAAASMGDVEFEKIVRPHVVDLDMWKSILNLSKNVIPNSKLNHLFSCVLAHMGATGFRSQEDISAESLSSFAGKNVGKIALFALPEYSRIVGSSKSAYSKKAVLVTVTHNPDTMNKRKRLLALRDSKKAYIIVLKKRIKDIEEMKVTHYADNAAITHDGNHIPRLTFLRCRLMIAQCCNFNEEYVIDEVFFRNNLIKKLMKMQRHIIERTKAKIEPLDLNKIDFTLDNVSPLFNSIKDHLDSSKVIHFFRADIGQKCVTETLAWASQDRDRELQTTYAISPGNISSKYSHIIESKPINLDDEEQLRDASYIKLEDRDEVYQIVNDDDEEESEIELIHKQAVDQDKIYTTKTDSNTGVTAYFEVERMEDVNMKVKGGWLNPIDYIKEEEDHNKAKIEKERISALEKSESKTTVSVPTLETITNYQKDLFTCLVNDLYSIGFLKSLFPNSPDDIKGLYKYIDVFNKTDAELRAKFGDVTSTLSFAGAEWDDDYFTILDEEDDSDVAAD